MSWNLYGVIVSLVGLGLFFRAADYEGSRRATPGLRSRNPMTALYLAAFLGGSRDRSYFDVLGSRADLVDKDAKLDAIQDALTSRADRWRAKSWAPRRMTVV